MIVLKDTPLNIGTSSVQALAANPSRATLIIQNKHATQTLRASFGAAATADVTQVQLIAFSSVPDAGTWKVLWNGNLTASLAKDITAGALQTALQLVAGLGSVTVSGDFTAGFTVTMTSATPNVTPDLPLLAISANTLTTSSVAVVTTVSITTHGTFANGVVIPAANGQITLTGQACPIDSVFLIASGANTRAEVMEG